MKEWSQDLYERFISRPAISLCMRWEITPNQITIFNFMLIMTAGICAFVTRHYFIGLSICLVNGLLDYIDGDLARATNQKSMVGSWLDTGGDVIIQNSIMAAIAFGLLTRGPATPILPAAIMCYFVGNAAMNLISFHYNETFGFSSHMGSALFRKYMDTKPHALNRFLKNLIDPTSSAIGMAFWTVRYWLVLGILAGRMEAAFYIITALTTFKWISMYIIFAMHLSGYKKLWLLQALAIIDIERQEFYTIRDGGGK